jgi:hypothetical protein
MSKVPGDVARRTPDPSLAELIALIPAEQPHTVSAYAPRKLTLAEMRASWSTSDKRTLVSANVPESITSDNPRPSRAYGEDDVQALVAQLIASRAARGHRKMMRRPSRRRGQRDLFDIVRLHLRRLSRRVLNDRCRDGLEPPSEQLLAEALESYVRQQLWPLIYHHDYGDQREPNRVRRTYLDDSRNAVESVARSSAAYALTTWAPEYIQDMQRLGAIGGRISKRKPSWTAADLDRLAALEGRTVAQQAAELGRSRSSIDRMRRALRERK